MQKYTQNRLFVMALVVFCYMSVQSQVLQWSNPTKLKGSAIFTKVIGENEEGVFLLRYRNKFFSKNVILEKYRHHLAFETSKSIDLKRARLVYLKMMRKGLLLVKSEFNRKGQNNRLIAQYYDFNLKPIGEEITLQEQEIKEFGDRGNFRVRISEDQTEIAVLTTSILESGKAAIAWRLYNQDLVLKSSKEVELPYNYDKMIVDDFMINGKSKVATLIREQHELDRRTTTSTYGLYILDGDTLHDYALSDSFDIKEIEMSYDRSKDQVLLISLFGDKKKYGIRGTMIFHYGFESQKSNNVITLFGEQLVKKLELREKEKNVISEGFEFLKVIPRSDGGILLIAEQKDIATESDIVMVNGIPQSTSKNIYNFDDILVLNLDSVGGVDWSHVVHKNQTTVNDGGYYSSAIVYVGEKYIQLIYNDQIRSSGDVMQYTLYSNGKIMSRKLLKAELDYVVVIPPESEQVSSNKIIIPTSKNRRFALLKLVYD